VRTKPNSNAAARPTIELIADGVVAAYIHEISERHRDQRNREDPAPRSSRLSRVAVED